MNPAPRFIALACIWMLSFCNFLQPDSVHAQDFVTRHDAVENLHGDLNGDLNSSKSFAYVGTGSCSYCHGSTDESAASTIGREYKIWINDDPHSDAYTTLLSPQSRKIARHLGLKNAHQAQVCLDCHAVNAKPDNADLKLAATHRHSIVDGVGCESCHGAAEKWLVPHTTHQWEQLSLAQKQQFGFNDTADLVTRGKVCAECHVGSADKDMNHDLIASGHPRLLFELSAYQALLPRHWSRNEDKQNNSAALEAKLWSVGQATSMIKTVELLETRAGKYDSPWPEFSEYGCYECHHDLRSRKNELGGPFDSGQLNWATWHRPSLELMVKSTLVPGSGDSDLLARVENLKQEMAQPLPDRGKVILLSRELKRELEIIARQLAGRDWSEGEFRDQFREITTVDPLAVESNWDGLTQRYLAAVSIRQAAIDSRPYNFADFSPSNEDKGKQATKQGLLAIRNQLYFESGYDSPHGFNRTRRTEISRLFSDVGKLFEFEGAQADGVPAFVVRE